MIIGQVCIHNAQMFNRRLCTFASPNQEVHISCLVDRQLRVVFPQYHFHFCTSVHKLILKYTISSKQSLIWITLIMGFKTLNIM